MTPAARAAHIRGMKTAQPIPFKPFETVPEVFTAEHEATYGKWMIESAAAHPALGARATRDAADYLVCPLRESYAEYWSEPADAEDRAEALDTFRRNVPYLPADVAESYLAMVAYTVHTEMKFRADPAYILDPDHDFELLVDPADYRSEEDLLEAGVEDNIKRLEALADTVAAYAFSLAVQISEDLAA